jgi:heptosyltransferase III
MGQLSPIIMILHPGALGDGLLSLTAIRSLRVTFPDHRMVWVGHKDLGDVFVDAHEVHESYAFDRMNFARYGGTPGLQQGRIPSLFQECEMAIGWMNDTGGIWEKWLKSVGINHLILRSPHDPLLTSHHMADRYVETLQPWSPIKQVSGPLEKKLADRPRLRIHRANTVKPSCATQRIHIVLHPGSGGMHKCAPPDFWVAIVNGLMARPNRSICLVGGDADTAALRKVAGMLTHHAPTILEGMDLLSVGRCLQHSHLFLGHDSGLSHLAGRLGVPSVLLFGPTDPAMWGPRGEHVVVIRKFCSCFGKASILHCSDTPCFSVLINEVMEKAEEALGRRDVSLFREPLEIDRAPHVPCLG